jgi:hypothetical protein
MAGCPLSMARTTVIFRGGARKRDDEIEAGRALTGLKKRIVLVGEGFVYGGSDDGWLMRRVLRRCSLMVSRMRR